MIDYISRWSSGGPFVIFCNKEANPNISNLIIMGKTTSDLGIFDTLGESAGMEMEVSN